MRFFQSVRPGVRLLFSLRLGGAVSLLNLPDKMVFLAGKRLNVIVCEFASALARGPCKLSPLAFDLIPIHVFSWAASVSAYLCRGTWTAVAIRKAFGVKLPRVADAVPWYGEMCMPKGRFCTWVSHRRPIVRTAAGPAALLARLVHRQKRTVPKREEH
jgi:hypothetical protein